MPIVQRDLFMIRLQILFSVMMRSRWVILCPRAEASAALDQLVPLYTQPAIDEPAEPVTPLRDLWHGRGFPEVTFGYPVGGSPCSRT